MKNYILGYAVLVAMASTALAEDIPSSQYAPPPTYTEVMAQTYGQPPAVAAPAEGYNNNSTIVVENRTDSPLFAAVAQVQDNKAYVIGEYSNTIKEVALRQYSQPFPFPTDQQGILLVSTNKEALEAVQARQPSLMELRRTSNVEFKKIPYHCTKVMFQVAKGRTGTLSKGLIGRLKIEVNKTETKCTPSKARQAYEKTKARIKGSAAYGAASDVGASIKRKAGEAGDWLSEKGEAAYGSMKSGAQAVKKSASKASHAIIHKLSASRDPSLVGTEE